jgi:hypothetical protein
MHFPVKVQIISFFLHIKSNQILNSTNSRPFICTQNPNIKTIFHPNLHRSNGAIKTPTQLTENPENRTKQDRLIAI